MRLFSLALLAAITLQASQPDVPAVEGRIREFVPPLPPGGTYISDARGLIGAGPLASLNARIGALQREGLGDIAVAIIPSIGDYTPSEVGVAIYRTWRVGRVDSIGSARRNLGVLLLIVPKELAPDSSGVCWITTGRGAEGIVTDAASGRICRDVIVPHLRERDYAAAVTVAVDALEERLRGDEGLAAEQPSNPVTGDGPSPRWLWVFPAGLLAIGGGAAGARYWRRHHRRNCPSCGRRMERLSERADDAELEHGQRVEERVKSIDYDVWRCPACRETIVLPYGRVFSSYRKCEACGRKTLRTMRKVVRKATYTRTGIAEDTHRCAACGATRVEQVVLPKETPPSATSSSSGGGGGFGGGGGGGGGFGGSGSTGGGGGGSRY
jgi:uncharacterized protein